MLGGHALFSKGPGDVVSQEGGAEFMMLGFAIEVGGVSLVAHVAGGRPGEGDRPRS